VSPKRLSADRQRIDELRDRLADELGDALHESGALHSGRRIEKRFTLGNGQHRAPRHELMAVAPPLEKGSARVDPAGPAEVLFVH